MNKTQLIGLIKSRIASLDALIHKLDCESAKETDGRLVVATERGLPRYYHVTGSSDSQKRKYLNDKSEISILAKKRYNHQLREAAEKERKLFLDSLIRLQKPVSNSDVETAYDLLPESVKPFVRPDVITDEGYASAWQAGKVLCARKTAAHTVKTLRGEYVRSKSEALIADRFYSLDIPYRYEQRFIVDEMTEFYLHPDFRVLNKRTRAEFIWEHCGMMDDPKYSNDAIDRLVIFSSKGYFQGKNLIFTYETGEKPLNMDYVDRLIKEFLL